MVAHVSPFFATLVLWWTDDESDILTCDNQKIFGPVGTNHSAAARCHSTPAGRSRAPRFPTSQGLPLDSKATLPLAIERH